MPTFAREEMEEMMRRWLEANERAEAAGDWTPMAEFYSEDAEYTWNLGPNEDFVARGRQQIRDWVLGTEMEGLEGWRYPYDRVLIDEKQGEVVAFWRQVAPASRPDGTPYEVRGVGGSWFRYAGNYRWAWQKDFFDFGNAMALFMELIQAGKLSPSMQKRIARVMAGEVMPGHVKRAG
jgi:SnoaL-like protein